MTNKTILRNFLLAVFMMLGASQSFAVGLGFSLGTGNETWENDRLHEGDRSISNVGFVIDSAVARNKIFNYRFTFMKEDNETDSRGLDMKGYAMTHDFGLAVYQHRAVRLWIGPELKAMLYSDLSSSSTNLDIEGDVVGFGIGPVFGVNVHLPKVVSFSFTAAYHIISAYSGDYHETNYYNTVDVDADSTGLYLNASIIFRINE